MYTYRYEYVKCGKKTCRRCPHGPYWYAYWREGGFLRKRYIGKTRPDKVLEDVGTVGHPHDQIFNRRTATVALAVQIMGLDNGFTKADLVARYRKLAWECHPDREGDAQRMRHVNAAYSFLVSQRLMF